MSNAQGKDVVLHAEALTKTYHDGTRTLTVLQEADLTLTRGEVVAIVGPSGAGKSTLMHLLGALDRPTSGRILLQGRDLSDLDDTELAEVRARHFGFVFQFHHLLSEFSAVENVMIPGMILGEDRASVRARATDLLTGLGLGERLTHRPQKLSGGEQQRVAIARALINNPLVLFGDEPTGNLDVVTADAVRTLLWDNVRATQRSLVIVTHDAEIAAKADRILRLRQGRFETA